MVAASASDRRPFERRSDMSSIAAGLKWMLPHGVVSRLGRAELLRGEQGESRGRQRLFEQFVPAGSVAFDIGANRGNRIAALLDCGATVIAVEPQPDCAAWLRRTYGDRVTVVQAAAGRAAGKLPLHLGEPFDVVASLSPEFISAARETQRFGDREWTRSIEVEVITLDSLISRYGAPSFIKIDVEGFEFEVLCGLSQVVDVVSFEWTCDSPERAVQCIDYLVGLGMPFFQFSFGESMLFAHRVSLDAAKAKQLVGMLGEEASLFGDIYASRRQLLNPRS
jgi:FkbM family methyltransferase